MLLIPAIAASLTLLVPSALGFGGDLTIWVAAGSEIDTVLEVQRETEAKSDIYAITSESAGEHTTTKKGTTFNRLYREDFDSTVSFRPYVFRRGTDEVDGGHETKCYANIGVGEQKAIFLDESGTQDVGFQLQWFLGLGLVYDSTTEASVNCTGEPEGIMIPRPEE